MPSLLYIQNGLNTCETSTKMAIFNSNGSFHSFYPNLPKISIIHKMSKNKAFS